MGHPFLLRRSLLAGVMGKYDLTHQSGVQVESGVCFRPGLDHAAWIMGLGCLVVRNHSLALRACIHPLVVCARALVVWVDALVVCIHALVGRVRALGACVDALFVRRSVILFSGFAS